MGGSAEEFGPYLVYEQLGLGGMATVHRAETTGLAGFRRPVALKRMLPSVADNAELVRSFIREARLASYLRHENVAQTYDLGKVGETYFIAMELVTGRNLREILKHCAAVAGPVPIPIAMNIINQICDALDYAHDLCDESGQPLGLIHRDVSPANVIVSESGVVKLIDFGIAKASAQGMQTVSRTIKGKFAYMAPEYIGGRIDARADLFALGVVAHELLANRPLFQGRDEMATLANVKDMPIDPPTKWRADVPPEIESIVMTALARDPDKRWQKAQAMRQALTTETKRLGLIAVNSQVVEWIERAFKSGPRPDSEPSHSISTGMMLGTRSGDTDVGETKQLVIEELDEADLEAADSLPTTLKINTPPPIRGAPPNVARRSSQQPMEMPPRPSQPQPAQRSSAVQAVVNRPSAPQPVESGPRTLPGVGARKEGISSVLNQLEHSVVSGVKTNVAVGAPSRLKSLLYAMLVLAIAAGTAAVVYFVLPYFT